MCRCRAPYFFGRERKRGRGDKIKPWGLIGSMAPGLRGRGRKKKNQKLTLPSQPLNTTSTDLPYTPYTQTSLDVIPADSVCGVLNSRIEGEGGRCDVGMVGCWRVDGGEASF